MGVFELVTWDCKTCLSLFILILLVYCIVEKLFSKYCGHTTPPGPWGLPIVGHLHYLTQNSARTLMKMSEKYGDLFCIQIGNFPTIVLNSNAAIREALIDKADIFSDRPPFFTCKAFGMNTLAFGSYTPRWKIHRKISERVLGDFVLKNSSLVDMINTEAEVLVSKFLDSKGQEYDAHKEIYVTVGSIIYQTCFGADQNCRENETFIKMINSTEDFVRFIGAGNPIDALPWLQYIMTDKVKQLFEIVNEQKSLTEKAVKEHISSYDAFHHRGITDGLIFAAGKYCGQSDRNGGITKEEILSTVRDFLGGGYQTVSTALEWLILYLAAYPDIQRKVQHEIDAVIVSNHLTNNDKENLPFTESVILETLRLCPVSPLLIPHAGSMDTTFRNYRIKKGTVVICNSFATTRDPLTWKNPEEFYPERFLDGNGKIIRTQADKLLSFSVGRRRCPGKYLANMELLIFVTNIFKFCCIELCNKPDFTGEYGLVFKPTPYTIKVTPRC